MKILYLTRHFNRSGYYILNELIKKKFDIAGVVLKKSGRPLVNPIIRNAADLFYRLKCKYYGCDPVGFRFSEAALAAKKGLNIIYTDDINSDAFYNVLLKLSPEVIVLGGGWHQLLSRRVFDFSALGTINTHPSLLPLYRGTSVHRWQIRDGVSKSGVTIHYVKDSFDTGDIIAVKEVEIGLDDTPQSLFDKTAKESAGLIVEVLNRIGKLGKEQKLRSQSQDQAAEHYFHKWTWYNDFLEINWGKSFLDIYNFVRACHQESYWYTGPVFAINGKKYFLRKALLVKNVNPQWTQKPGVFVFKIDVDGISLSRRNDPHTLVIRQAQRYDRFYRFRRGTHAFKLASWNRLSVGDDFLALSAKRMNK